MNVSDVVNRVKRTFGDEAGVQITDADVIRWINDAQLQICVKNDGLLETTVATNVVKGQQEYASPVDILKLRSIMHNGYRIKNMSFAEFNEYVDGFKSPTAFAEGEPQVFMVWNNSITLFPTPSVSITGGLKVYYTRTPASVGTLADALTVPLEYHISIVDYCLEQAHALDEDLEKAAYSKARFEDTVRELSDENKWTSNEYYPRITTLPEDENFGYYGY